MKFNFLVIFSHGIRYENFVVSIFYCFKCLQLPFISLRPRNSKIGISFTFACIYVLKTFDIGTNENRQN